MAKAKTEEHLKRIEMGFILSQLRIEGNFNPYSLSKLANINPEIILNIELGTTNYKIDSFLKYLAAIDVELQLVKRPPKES